MAPLNQGGAPEGKRIALQGKIIAFLLESVSRGEKFIPPGRIMATATPRFSGSEKMKSETRIIVPILNDLPRVKNSINIEKHFQNT